MKLTDHPEANYYAYPAPTKIAAPTTPARSDPPQKRNTIPPSAHHPAKPPNPSR